MHERIQKAVREVVGGEGSFVVERPANPAFGDYAVFVGMEKAAEVAEHMKKELGDEVAKVDIAGAGFVNITLSRAAVNFLIDEADAQGTEWGKNNDNENKRIIAEYTDPNPFKEFHIGHLMSNAIGESIARLFEASGAEVSRANYQGDVGLHVAKAIWGKQQQKESSWGEAYVFGSKQYEEHKDEIDALNKVIYEKSDPTVNALYDEGRAESLEHFEDMYRVLGTKFVYYFFESEVGPIGLDIVKKHPEIFEESEGAVVFKGEPYGLHTRVFINSRGLPTYEAKELGLVEAKKRRGNFDIFLTITANEISGYFKVVRKVAEMIFPDLESKILVRFHGLLKLTTGKMSSREGNVITAAQFIEDIIKKASEKNPDPLIAEQVAIGAIKYMILRQAPGSDIIFDEEKSLSLNGDSGPYLQYALVRAKKILMYAAGEGNGTDVPAEPYPIERIILHFPEVVARATRELAPNLLVNYLIELAAAWNSFYATEQILGSSEEAYKQRVARAFANTMSNGFTLLGIPAPEKM
jgi:arginyl-tRNA synthetase